MSSSGAKSPSSEVKRPGTPPLVGGGQQIPTPGKKQSATKRISEVFARLPGVPASKHGPVDVRTTEGPPQRRRSSSSDDSSSGRPLFGETGEFAAQPRLSNIEDLEQLARLTRFSTAAMLGLDEPAEPKKPLGFVGKIKEKVAKRASIPTDVELMFSALKQAQISDDLQLAVRGADRFCGERTSQSALDKRLGEVLKAKIGIDDMLVLYQKLSIEIGPLNPELYERRMDSPPAAEALVCDLDATQRLRMVQFAIARELSRVNPYLSPVLHDQLNSLMAGARESTPGKLAADFSAALDIASDLIARPREQGFQLDDSYRKGARGALHLVMDALALQAKWDGHLNRVKTLLSTLPPRLMLEIDEDFVPVVTAHPMDRAELKTLVHECAGAHAAMLAREKQAEATAAASIVDALLKIGGGADSNQDAGFGGLSRIGVGAGVFAFHDAIKRIRPCVAASGQRQICTSSTLAQAVVRNYRSMSQAQKAVLAAVVRHPDMVALLDAIRELRRRELIRENPGLATELEDLQTVLVALRGSEAANVQETELKPIRNLETLNANVRWALGAYGIEIGIDNYFVQLKKRVVPPSARTKAEEIMPKKVPADHSFEPEGRKKLETYLADVAYDAIRAAWNSGPLFYANDGTPLELVGRFQGNFRLTKSPDGLLTFHYSTGIQTPTHAYAGTGKDRPLIQVSGEPATMSLQIKVNPETREMTIDGDVTVEQGDIGEALWSLKRFPDITIDQVVAVDANPSLVRAYLSVAKARHTEANFQFIHELRAIESRPIRPSIADIQLLIQKFIKQDAAKQVNLAAELRGQIEQAANLPEAEALAALAGPRGLIAAARHEMLNVMRDNDLALLRSSLVETRREIEIAKSKIDLGAAQPWWPGSLRRSVEELPPVRDEAQRTVASNVGIQIEALARRFATSAKLNAATDLLRSAMGEHGAQGPEAWNRFEQYVVARIRMMPAAMLASLRHNIESEPGFAKNKYVKIVHAAAVEALEGTREARLTYESLMAETGFVDPRLLAEWLNRGLIDLEQLSAVMVHMPTELLVQFSSGQDLGVGRKVAPVFQTMAIAELQVRVDRLDQRAKDFMRAVAAFVGEARNAAKEIPTVIKLDEKLKLYQSAFDAVARPKTKIDRELDALKQVLADRLDGTFALWEGEGISNDVGLDRLAVALRNLGASTEPVTGARDLGRIALRQAALAKEALAQKAPAQEVDIPPPPPEDPPSP